MAENEKISVPNFEDIYCSEQTMFTQSFMKLHKVVQKIWAAKVELQKYLAKAD